MYFNLFQLEKGDALAIFSTKPNHYYLTMLYLKVPLVEVGITPHFTNTFKSYKVKGLQMIRLTQVLPQQ